MSTICHRSAAMPEHPTEEAAPGRDWHVAASSYFIRFSRSIQAELDRMYRYLESERNEF